MFKGVDHVAIAVNNIEESLKFYSEVLGLDPGPVETSAEQGVRAVHIPVGQGSIELIEPLSSDSGVGRFLERRGEGLHHICLGVEDVDKELGNLAAKGVQLLDKKGRPGLRGKVGFLHPGAARGVLIELSQEE
ncbi:MAG: methylmalonyl-CoA epimerase [Chloroflexi bacterium]|nr:methylmalonyl-CoA epimerase [Chloroflexota bacterium]